eukprot:4069911-Prymnesium_polylepis.1
MRYTAAGRHTRSFGHESKLLGETSPGDSGFRGKRVKRGGNMMISGGIQGLIGCVCTLWDRLIRNLAMSRVIVGLEIEPNAVCLSQPPGGGLSPDKWPTTPTPSTAKLAFAENHIN